MTTLALLPALLLMPQLQAAERLTADYECQRIGRKLGSVSINDCKHANLTETGHYSNSGYPLLLKEYPPLASRKHKAKVLLIGGIHGDEYSSVSVVFKWMQTLDKHHSGLFHWHIVPLMNPDGLLQTKSSRLNAKGVDLNRNLPTDDWATDAHAYWQKKLRSDPRRYPGVSATSEPEAQWLVEEIERFKPDAIIAVHAPYGILDFDGPNHAPPGNLGYLRLNMLGTYPGSLGRYAGVSLGLPVLTIELPYAGIMPSRDQISGVWVDLIAWLKNNL